MFKRLKMPRMIEKLCEYPGCEWTEIEITAFQMYLLAQPNYSTLHRYADGQLYVSSSQADAGDAISKFHEGLRHRLSKTTIIPSNPEHYYVFKPLWWICRDMNGGLNRNDYIEDLKDKGKELIDEDLDPLGSVLKAEELKERPDRTRKLVRAIKSCLNDDFITRIFFLRFLFDHQYSDIVKMVGIEGKNPAGNVRTCICRAKNKLANCPDVKKALEDYK